MISESTLRLAGTGTTLRRSLPRREPGLRRSATNRSRRSADRSVHTGGLLLSSRTTTFSTANLGQRTVILGLVRNPPKHEKCKRRMVDRHR